MGHHAASGGNEPRQWEHAIALIQEQPLPAVPFRSIFLRRFICCEGLPVIAQLKPAIWVLINLYESAHNLTAPRNELHAPATKGSRRGIRKGADMLISCRLQPGSGSFPPTSPSLRKQRNLWLFPIATKRNDCQVAALDREPFQTQQNTRTLMKGKQTISCAGSGSQASHRRCLVAYEGEK